MADKYLVPQRLDDPELIGFWTIDEFAGLLIPFAWGILAQHIFIGIALAFAAWFVLRKAKSGNAGSALVHAAYWYMPGGFLRQTNSSSSSQVSTSAAGLSRSLTEAQTYSVEARRAEELASRLENQASWYEGANASGSLNLSQAYREWGMAELEANRDYYGPVRFDDINFQMSAQGQQLQARFVESYADRLHDDIEGQLTLPEFAPVSRPAVTSQGSVRVHGPSGGGGSGNLGAAPDTSGISEEVRAAQARGRGRIGQSRSNLDATTRAAKGASEEAADEVKEW